MEKKINLAIVLFRAGIFREQGKIDETSHVKKY